MAFHHARMGVEDVAEGLAGCASAASTAVSASAPAAKQLSWRMRGRPTMSVRISGAWYCALTPDHSIVS